MQERSAFRLISEQASRQAGCVSRQALLAAGISPGTLRQLAAREALLRIPGGVYGYGITTLSPEALRWAALLVAGAGARLGHRSALEVHGVLPPVATQATVVVPRRSGAIARRLVTELPPAAGRNATISVVPTRRPGTATWVGGIWADDVLRAIDDLAAGGCLRELRKAWREADYLGLLREEDVRRHLSSAPPGAGAVRDLLRAVPIVGAGEERLSRAERRLLEAIVRAGLPTPLVNGHVDFAGVLLRPDFWFVDEQLAVEIDGDGHTRPSRAAADRERDEYLRDLGVEVVRFTDDAARDQPHACVLVLTERLATRAGQRAQGAAVQLTRP